MTESEIETFVLKDQQLSQVLTQTLKDLPNVQEACDTLGMTLYAYRNQLQQNMAWLVIYNVAERVTDPGRTFEETLAQPLVKLDNWTKFLRLKPAQERFKLLSLPAIRERLEAIAFIVGGDQSSTLGELKVIDTGLNDDENEFCVTFTWLPEKEQAVPLLQYDRLHEQLTAYGKYANIVLIRGYVANSFLMALAIPKGVKIVEQSYDSEVNNGEGVKAMRALVEIVGTAATYILLDVGDFRDADEIVQAYWAKNQLKQRPVANTRSL